MQKKKDIFIFVISSRTFFYLNKNILNIDIFKTLGSTNILHKQIGILFFKFNFFLIEIIFNVFLLVIRETERFFFSFEHVYLMDF